MENNTINFSVTNKAYYYECGCLSLTLKEYVFTSILVFYL